MVYLRWMGTRIKLNCLPLMDRNTGRIESFTFINAAVIIEIVWFGMVWSLGRHVTG